MNVFKFISYKEFINCEIKNASMKGRGILKALAKHARVHSTYMSHIFHGDKNLSLEQACLVCDYFNLNELETDYFLNLVQYERAGSFTLKNKIKKRIDELKQDSAKVEKHIGKHVELTDKQKTKFYSHWGYSAIRLLCTIENFQTIEKIINVTKLEKSLVLKITSFLLEVNLCQKKGNKIITVPYRTHIKAGTDLVSLHHKNWRLKSIEHSDSLDDENELMFTAPLTISKKDMPIIREKILKLISEVSEVVEQTEPDQLACMNIDWIYM